MPTPMQRPIAGAMKVTAFTKVSEEDYELPRERAFKIDRPVSYIVRQALIEGGYIPGGK